MNVRATSRYLLDTNVLLRDSDELSAQHEHARRALHALTASGAELCLVPQSLYEFWAVASRPPAANGMGLSATASDASLSSFLAGFVLMPDVPAIFDEWRRLAQSYAPQGKPTHDARLVAAMKIHGIGNVLTFNGDDFKRYQSGEDIVIVDPASVA